MFAIDWTAFWVVVVYLIFLFFFLRRRYSVRPHLAFSNVAGLNQGHMSWRVHFAKLPRCLQVIALIFFLLAFIDPHLLKGKDVEPTPLLEEEVITGGSEQEEVLVPTKGVALYLALDRSSSMDERISVLSKRGRKLSITKIELLKRVTSAFIRGSPELGLRGRRNDMVGLVSFARVADVLAPLTLDHHSLLERLSKLQSVRESAEDGTAIGYAIYKIANLIVATKQFSQDLVREGKPAYDIKSTAIVLVTDGLHSPHPLDAGHRLRTIGVADAAAFARDHGIHVYVVNVEPAILRPEYSAARQELEQAAEMTGGRFFVTDGSVNLLDIYAAIDRLEKSVFSEELKLLAEIDEKVVPKTERPRTFSFYPYLIVMGMLALFIGLLLDTTWLRRVP